MQEGKYTFLVAVLVVALIVSALAALRMLRFPSAFQPPVAIANLLRRPPQTSTIQAAPSTVPSGQPLTTPSAPRRAGQSRFDGSAPLARELAAPARVETPQAESATVPAVPGSASIAVGPPNVPEPLQSSEIYSAGDGDVIPPKANRPQQFSFQRFDLPTGEIVTFELIIDEKGRVESTRVMNPSPTLAATMLYTMALQAIRSWEFEPALKAGIPVRFRSVISFFGSGQEVSPQESREREEISPLR